MIPIEFHEKIKEIYNSSRSWRYAKKDIQALLGFIPEQQAVYDIVHGITESDKLAKCGKTKKFRHFSFGYEYCQRNCACMVEAARAKAGATMMHQYGVDHPMKSPEIRDRMRVTNQERYGVDYPLQNKEIREKVILTNLDRLGVSYPTMNADVRSKIEETNRARYGSDYPLDNAIVRQKVQDTNLDRYGHISPLGNDMVQERSRQTHFMRNGVINPFEVLETKNKAKVTMRRLYGVEHAMQSEELRSKSKKTNLDLYGVEVASRRNITTKSLRILDDKSALENFLQGKSYHSCASELGISYSTFLRTCQRHGIHDPQRSSFEGEIATFLDTHGIEYVQNARKPLSRKFELDFFLPQYMIGIEFNGLYWHSTAILGDTRYHQRKFQACQNAGIRLLMINEDEWIERGPAWKSRILSILGKSERAEGARKLSLRVISQHDANAFFSINHIQGPSRATKFAIGGFIGEVLVVAMAFNQQRNTQDIELIRFCTDGKSRAGAFSKLLKFAVASCQYNKIVSFADLRHSNGQVYEANDFTKVGIIPPDYRYVYRGTTYHKSSFTKSKISKKFNIDMSEITEKTAMERLKIPRIYDCGKIKFVYTRE